MKNEHSTPLPIQLFSKSQHRQHVARFPIKCSSSSDNGNESQPITPLNTVEIRIRRRPSKRQRQKEEEMINAGKQAVKPKSPPKDWESMNLTEKAIELYLDTPTPLAPESRDVSRISRTWGTIIFKIDN
ncbi:hypothetical protein KY290_014985 [Solanum tuberosum]|uniref:Uncharacterized protein n=1 Tax=Solanum tuberosum TaxID=4113 RepID=A0ABQ7VR90_SOLTU|nr:hypothetical protein KY290_014985 [Solanum tuberosum]